jgi:hypothetical protein
MGSFWETPVGKWIAELGSSGANRLHVVWAGGSSNHPRSGV